MSTPNSYDNDEHLTTPTNPTKKHAPTPPIHTQISQPQLTQPHPLLIHTITATLITAATTLIWALTTSTPPPLVIATTLTTALIAPTTTTKLTATLTPLIGPATLPLAILGHTIRRKNEHP